MLVLRRLLLLAAAATLAGCASAPRATAPPTTGPTSSAPAALEVASAEEHETPLSLEAQAEGAFVTALRSYHDLVQRPDPADERLTDGFAGPSLRRVQEILAVMAGAGHRADGSATAEIVVIGSRRVEPEDHDAGADVVEVEGCLIDGAVIVDRTGRVVDDDATSRRLVARVRREADGWRLVEERTEQVWNDLDGCDR